MSNRNNPSNFNEDGLFDETNENQRIVGFICILIPVMRYVPQGIPLSILVIDQQTMNTHEWTNEHIDQLIQRPPDLRRIATTIGHTILWHLLILLLPYYWHLMMCILTIYAITSINTQPNETANMVHLRVDALLGNTLNLYQDAEAEGRTAQPTDSDIEFSSTVEMLTLPQLSIEDTQDHDLDAPTNLDNIRQTDPVDENPSNEEILQSLSDKIRRLHEIMDELNRTRNTFVAIESEDNIDSSDSSEEEDSSLSSEDGHDGDDESESLDDIQSQGPTSPIPAIRFNPNHVQSNQTDLVLDSTTSTTGSNIPLNQAQDIDPNVHDPTDFTRQLILSPPRLTYALVPKAHNRSQIHDESSDEHVS